MNMLLEMNNCDPNVTLFHELQTFIHSINAASSVAKVKSCVLFDDYAKMFGILTVEKDSKKVTNSLQRSNYRLEKDIKRAEVSIPYTNFIPINLKDSTASPISSKIIAFENTNHIYMIIYIYTRQSLTTIIVTLIASKPIENVYTVHH